MGNVQEECEDFCYPTRNKEISAPALRFAIADGASESLLSGQWARILTLAFCRSHNDSCDFNAFYQRALRAWEKWKQSYINKRARIRKPIQWYEEPGLEAGAFSTFLGLRIEDENLNAWQAIAVGDSCLFQVRDNDLIISFPISASKEFGNFPGLLCSNSQKNKKITEIIRSVSGRWAIKDRFYLASDALAQWIIKEHEQGGEPWSILDEFILGGGKNDFLDWLLDLRIQRKIRNDDIALMRIQVD